MTDEKLTYQMKSPGEAWNDFVNSKEGHNAQAVTPAYLDSNNQDKRPAVDKKVEDRKKELEKQKSQGLDQNQDKSKEQKQKEDKERDKDQ